MNTAVTFAQMFYENWNGISTTSNGTGDDAVASAGLVLVVSVIILVFFALLSPLAWAAIKSLKKK